MWWGCREPPSRPSASREPTAAEASSPTDAAPTLTAGITLLRDDPVVEPAQDLAYVNPGAVIVDDEGRLHMLRNSFDSFPGASRTDHLVSTDGLTWDAVSVRPELTTDDVPFADSSTSTFVMTAYVEDAGTWVGYLYAFTGLFTPGLIGRATAPGPEGPWTVDAEPILEPGPEGAWDGVRIAEPSVVRTDDGLAMYYTGVDEDGVSRIGLATSRDGIRWEKHDDPATGDAFAKSDPVYEGTGTWDGSGVGDPHVADVDGTLVMLYRSVPVSEGFGVGLALSADGSTWQSSPANPVMTSDLAPDTQFWQSEIAPVDGGTQLAWWLEVGAITTEVYAYRIGSELLTLER